MGIMNPDSSSSGPRHGPPQEPTKFTAIPADRQLEAAITAGCSAGQHPDLQAAGH